MQEICKRMSITFLIGNLSNSGGTQRMLILLCNELIKLYSITILVHKSGTSFFSLDKRVKVKVLKGNLLQKNMHIYTILKKNKSKYYINLDSNSVLFNGFLLPSHTSLIIWEHFSIIDNYKKWIFSLSRKYAVKRASHIVLLSSFEINQWQQLYNLPTQKAVLIYNPVTVEKSMVNTTNMLPFKTFLAIGNKTKVKGFDILLETWKSINTDWRLKIVGLSEPDINELQDFIEKNNLKNVSLYPKSKNICDFYHTSSAFVLSSRKETTPLVLLESQSYGLPAVVFNHLPGVMELLDDSALIADYTLPAESLKDKIEELINDKILYYKLSKNALKNAKSFNIKTFVQNWKEILQ